jgi:deoxyribodipyrimidine photo-lyase
MARPDEKKTAAQVVWFKRDMRTLDNRPLSEAARRGPVLPLLVVEPAWWAEPDMSARQYGFYTECIAELQEGLAELGQPLIIRVGDIVQTLDGLLDTISIAGLWSHEETGSAWTFARDMRVANWCQSNGIPWHEYRQDGVARRLKTRDGWARRWDKLMSEPRIPAPEFQHQSITTAQSERLPTAKQLGLGQDIAAMRQHGGRQAAMTTLATFFHARGEHYRYAMSSPLTAEHACSRLSPHLAWGTVSMREVSQMTQQRQRQLKQRGPDETKNWRASLVSFSGRLHWHCHFMQKLEDEPTIEFRNLHAAYDDLRSPGEINASRLAAWSVGETGLPFVDACMRFLGAHGWLNFRMRAMLMSTASYHLWLDWRQPGLHLARQFVDYEPGIHWPQVQMQSGTTGINTVRIYNPVKQGQDHDPDGEFVRRWVPELAEIEGSLIHTPWLSSRAERLLDKTYPMPIVDHMQAARDARQKIYGIRGTAAFREAADAIQAKHGSRKSGIPMTGQKRKQFAKHRIHKTENAQLTLDIDVPEVPNLQESSKSLSRSSPKAARRR